MILFVMPGVLFVVCFVLLVCFVCEASAIPAYSAPLKRGQDKSDIRIS